MNITQNIIIVKKHPVESTTESDFDTSIFIFPVAMPIPC